MESCLSPRTLEHIFQQEAGWAPNSPVAKRYINLAQEWEAVAEMQAAMSPLRTLARLRRPRPSVS